MKKILLILSMLLLSVFSYSQNKNVIQELSDSINDTKEQVQELRNQISLNEGKRNLNARINSVEKKIDKSGYYLKQSANFQYGAIGCASVAAGMFLIGTSTDSDTARYNCNVFGYVCAGASVFCEIMSITYKLKAGKNLMLKSSPIGLTASLTF